MKERCSPAEGTLCSSRTKGPPWGSVSARDLRLLPVTFSSRVLARQEPEEGKRRLTFEELKKGHFLERVRLLLAVRSRLHDVLAAVL